jgi:hypothetical protein
MNRWQEKPMKESDLNVRYPQSMALSGVIADHSRKEGSQGFMHSVHKYLLSAVHVTSTC